MYIMYQNKKVKQIKPLTKKEIQAIKGNKVRITLKDGSIINGYQEPVLKIDDSLYHEKVDYITVITRMLGQLDPYLEKVYVDDIVKMEEILYSSLRWTGKIDFTFEVEEE